MKTKKIIPLVILILMILGITGISIFSFNAREKDSYLNQTTSNEEMQEKNTKGNSETKINHHPIIKKILTMVIIKNQMQIQK